MLPWLKYSQDASQDSGTIALERKHDDDFNFLHSAAEDLIQAVHSKDVKAVAEALKAAFEICESEPHEEDPHAAD